MRKINLLILFLFAFLPFTAVKPVFAGFGVSPAEIYHDHLKPGSKFEKEIVLSRSEAEEDLKVVIETDLGETESWVKFEPSKEFLFPKGEKRKNIKAIITVPNNADNKNYKGLLRIKASSVNSASSGVSIVQGARMEVTLVTTSLNVNILNLKGIRIPDVDWQKPIKLFANIENTGNTEIAPDKIVLEILRLNKDPIETQEVTELEKISPNTTKEISAEFKNNLSGEEYFGIVKIYSDDKEIYSDRLVFKVNAAPEGYVKENKSNLGFANGIILFLKQNKTKTILFSLLILLPVLIGFFISKKSKSPVLKKVYFVLTFLYLIICLVLIYFSYQKWLANLAKPGDIGSVQGESVEITPTTQPNISVDNSSSLVIDKQPGYPIYRTPDVNSIVLYTAQEDETFKVIKEENGWYYILMGNGAGGWLPKSSVKSSN